MVSFSRYGFNLDDIWMWLEIYEHKPVWNGYNPSMGRFFPLASLDLNVLMQFSTSPYIFFAFNALLALIFALTWFYMLSFVSQKIWLNILLIAFFMLSMGFVIVTFGICYPERLLVVFLSIFIITSMLYLRAPTLSLFMLGILMINLCIYLKEPMFIAAFVFGFMLFISTLRISFVDSINTESTHSPNVSPIQADSINSHKKALRFYALGIMSSAALYALIYALFILPQMTKVYNRATPFTNTLVVKIQGWINFILNDGLIIALTLAIVCYRIYLILRGRDKIRALFDGLLCACLAYMLVYFALGIFEVYYLLPCYIWSGVAIMYYLFTQGYIKRLVMKLCIAFGLLGFFSSSLPMGFYTMINLKAMAVQFNELLDFSAKYIAQNPHTRIYFDGTGRGRDIYPDWYVRYFIEYLNRIYNVKDFDVMSAMPNGKDIVLDSISPYSYYNNLTITKPQVGDLLILNNTTSIYADSAYIAQLASSHSLIFTSTFSSIPYISIRSVIKGINFKFIGAQSALLGNANMFHLPLETYVFKVQNLAL
ncbi:hypothetical protein LS71_007405 [Helicobacter jaachi]|uniref:Uncharacterized protein n=1 Tax=Helicobacter jaachi TaxID=1677920 RepID=A0A4V6I2G3_9HELI|nr:hypothetical protein [Helicobacter jaachi]TLD96062.1 hypothetical protein LS71_007405 [Helicobacter jaachi]